MEVKGEGVEVEVGVEEEERLGKKEGIDVEGEGVGKGREEKEKEEEEDVGGNNDGVECAGTDLPLVPSLMQEEAPVPSESSPLSESLTFDRKCLKS